MKYAEDRYKEAYKYSSFKLTYIQIMIHYDIMDERMYQEHKNELLYIIAYLIGARTNFHDFQLNKNMQSIFSDYNKSIYFPDYLDKDFVNDELFILTMFCYNNYKNSKTWNEMKYIIFFTQNYQLIQD